MCLLFTFERCDFGLKWHYARTVKIILRIFNGHSTNTGQH